MVDKCVQTIRISSYRSDIIKVTVSLRSPFGWRAKMDDFRKLKNWLRHELKKEKTETLGPFEYLIIQTINHDNKPESYQSFKHLIGNAFALEEGYSETEKSMEFIP